MLFTKEGQTLYLNNWNYNSVLIINALSNIIENAGGTVKKSNIGFIENRTYTEKMFDCDEMIKRAEAAMQDGSGREDLLIKLIESKTAEKESLNGKQENSRRAVTNLNYISFTLDGVYYYLQFDNNFLFPFYYIKTPVKNNRISRDACLDELKKEWLFDCFLHSDCAEADIIEAANLIYNDLLKSSPSIIRRDSYKKRVPNTYNNKYHYEIVYKPDRFEDLAF